MNLATTNEDLERYQNSRSLSGGNQGIRTLIGEAYYSFPSVGTHNNLSRFLLGQALLISEIGNENLLKTKFAYASNVTTLVNLVADQYSNNLIIFNVKEAGRQNEPLDQRLPRLSDNTLSIFRAKNITKVVEINICGYTHVIAQDGSPSPRRYFIPNDNLSIMVEYRNYRINRRDIILELNRASPQPDHATTITCI